jgi:hypothetical protein
MLPRRLSNVRMLPSNVHVQRLFQSEFGLADFALVAQDALVEVVDVILQGLDALERPGAEIAVDGAIPGLARRCQFWMGDCHVPV